MRSARSLEQLGWRRVCSGVGYARAAEAAEQLLASGARRLLVWGSAGGLDPALASGTVVVPEYVVGPDGTCHALDPDWRRALCGAVPVELAVTEAPVATVRTPAGDTWAKEKLRARTSAAAVDMETAAVAAVAAAAGAACAALRVVADTATLALPRAVLDAPSTAHPAFQVARVLLYRPRDWPATLRLARAYHLACANLKATADALAEQYESQSLY